MNKPHKLSHAAQLEREEHSRHYFKIQKNQQQKKVMKDLDKALREKDYVKLVQQNDF